MKEYIMLLRHGKAKKNIENKHGGKGSSVVLEGINEINKLSAEIKNSDINFTRILYSERKQCIETAQILKKK